MKQSRIQAFTQSGYYKLTRRLMPQTLKACALLFAMLCVFGSAKLYGGFGGYSMLFVSYPYLMPYDALLQTTGVHVVFFGALAVFLVASTLRIHRDIYRGKGVYTVMTLPFPRRHVFFAYCTAGVLGILLLWAAQVALLLLWYPILTAACQNLFAKSELYQTAAITLYRTNGLFLAAVRGPLFKLLLPMTALEWLSTLLFALTLGCLPAYLLIGERKRASWVFAFPVVPMLGTAVVHRWSCATGEYGYSGLYSLHIADGRTAFIVSAALALALLAFILWRGVHNCNRDGNL